MKRLLGISSLAWLMGCQQSVPIPMSSVSPPPPAPAAKASQTPPASLRPNDGVVTALVHGAADPQAIAMDRRGFLYVLGRGVYEVNPENGVTRLLAPVYGAIDDRSASLGDRIISPFDIAVAPDGTLILPAYRGLYRIKSSGQITFEPGPWTTYQDMSAVVDSQGTVYVALKEDNYIWRRTADGQSGVFVGQPIPSDMRAQAEQLAGFVNGRGPEARFDHPTDLAIDGQDNLFVADQYNGSVRKVTPEGEVTTVYGTGRPTPGPSALSAFATRPEHLAVDPAGGLYVTWGNQIHRVSPTGARTPWLGADVSCDPTWSEGPTPDPALCDVDGTGTSARFNHPLDMVVDGTGTLFVVDERNRRIRRVR